MHCRVLDSSFFSLRSSLSRGFFTLLSSFFTFKRILHSSLFTLHFQEDSSLFSLHSSLKITFLLLKLPYRLQNYKKKQKRLSFCIKRIKCNYTLLQFYFNNTTSVRIYHIKTPFCLQTESTPRPFLQKIKGKGGKIKEKKICGEI